MGVHDKSYHEAKGAIYYPRLYLGNYKLSKATR